MIEVVAAIIWQNNKFLICQRSAHKARPLKWEFVGGKVDYGETKKEALLRECREELGIILNIGEIFDEVIYKYPEITVKITFYNAEIIAGEPSLLEHNDLKWITTKEIDKYTFCPADKLILEKLSNI